MPTWRNDNLTAKWFPGFQDLVGPDQVFTTIKYPYPAPSGFTLISHTPRKHQPWETLHEDALPVDIESGCAKYTQLRIVNNSGALITVVANEDTANGMVVLNGGEIMLDQDREIDALSITGDGVSGDVYVYGFRAE